MINIRINLIARPGKQNELMQSIRELTIRITKEPGCMNCQVYQNLDNEDELVVFEQWDNEKMAQAHLDSDNLAVLVGAGSVLSRDVSVSMSKDPAIAAMERIFKGRMVKEKNDVTRYF